MNGGRALLLFGVTIAAMTIASGADAFDFWDQRWQAFDQPCSGDCSVMVFGGRYVENAMSSIVISDQIPPWDWSYGDGGLVGLAISRRFATVFGVVDIEPEFGVGQRFGNMHETEVWAAVFFRYGYFPWNKYIRTTVAVSTGLNYATGISDEEQDRAHEGSNGAQLMHYLAPEITFALPDAPDQELVLRFHHRSGAFGLVNDAGGGAHYATVGIRVRF